MKRLLDCLVSYFGVDEEGQPTHRRYFSYHIIAGPGPTAGAGVASITTVALSDESERCTYCQNWHAVKTGGPQAAIAAAVHYLDLYHRQDRLWRVQSEIRGLAGTPAAVVTPAGPAHLHNATGLKHTTSEVRPA
jgi:hypothetical protein